MAIFCQQWDKDKIEANRYSFYEFFEKACARETIAFRGQSLLN